MNLQKPSEIYRYIVDYKQRHDGNSPSYRQIMAECRVSSVSMVHYYMGELQTMKLVRMLYEDNRRNGIAVVGGEWKVNNVPDQTPAKNT